MPTKPSPAQKYCRTVRLKSYAHLLPDPEDEWTAMMRTRFERESALEYRDLLGRFLTEAGYRFRSLLEEDPNGGWRIHFFATPDTLAYLELIVGDECGPGDPINLDAEWIVRSVEKWSHAIAEPAPTRSLDEW